MGAGLGGGSSDAAATILGLNQLLKIGWSREQMQSVAEQLGSDVPFFLFAPAAVVSGRGGGRETGVDGRAAGLCWRNRDSAWKQNGPIRNSLQLE